MKKLLCLLALLLAMNSSLQCYPSFEQTAFRQISSISEGAVTLAASAGGTIGVVASSPVFLLSGHIGSERAGDIVMTSGIMGAFSAIALPPAYLLYKLYLQIPDLRSTFAQGIVESKIDQLQAHSANLAYEIRLLKIAIKAYNTSPTYSTQDETNIKQIGEDIDELISEEISLKKEIKFLQNNKNSLKIKAALWTKKLVPTIGILALSALWTKGVQDWSKHIDITL